MPILDLTALAQWLGIAMPVLYAGITLQYSQTLSLLSTTSPPKLLALQWLRLYQQGPLWVPPLIYTGVLANTYLFFTSTTTCYYYSYPLAAALTLSIVPLTLLSFEPGINGACKWKAQTLLAEDGFSLPEGRSDRVGWSTGRHSAGPGVREWAEAQEMGELVRAWAMRNHGRWVLAVVAGVVSGWASLRGRG